MKLDQGLEVQVGRRKRHAQVGRASSWEGQDGKVGFLGPVEGDWSPAGSMRRVYLWELPAGWGELKAWIQGWHLRGRQDVEVRSREAWWSLCLGVGERDRSSMEAEKQESEGKSARQVH